MTFVAEILGTFVFTFGVAAVMYGKTPSSLSGLIVGGSLVLGVHRGLARGAPRAS